MWPVWKQTAAVTLQPGRAQLEKKRSQKKEEYGSLFLLSLWGDIRDAWSNAWASRGEGRSLLTAQGSKD